MSRSATITFKFIVIVEIHGKSERDEKETPRIQYLSVHGSDLSKATLQILFHFAFSTLIKLFCYFFSQYRNGFREVK